MVELLKNNNPFVNRELAKNINLTESLIKMLLDHYAAYTMLINLAKNESLSSEGKDQLYKIAGTKYKDSMLKEDLDFIFIKD